MTIKNIWNKFTDIFSHTIIYPQYFLKDYEDQAIQEAKKKAKGIVIDIGCGRQPYKKEFLPLVDKYIGIDHPNASKKYTDKEKPDILADASKIPLPTNHANLTMLISVLEHLPNPKEAIKESYRITKKGGHLVLITVQNYVLHDAPYDFYRYTKYGLKDLFEKAKFKVIRVKPLGNIYVLVGQYINVYLLYTIKDLIKEKSVFKKLLAFLLIFPTSIICILSNIFVYLVNKLIKDDKKGSFAIYNLIIAKKV